MDKEKKRAIHRWLRVHKHKRTVYKHLEGQHDNQKHGNRGTVHQDEAEMSRAMQLPGARPANDIVKNAPRLIQNIIDRSAIIYNSNLPAGAAGSTAWPQGDGSYAIPVSRNNPSKSIIVHEATHAHQSQYRDTHGHTAADKLERSFIEAARKDNQETKKPLWGSGYLDGGDGGEIWAAAAGFYYGGASYIMADSPRVKSLLDSLYGER
jgi:hypothetical protein